jgi:hypothetical protein
LALGNVKWAPELGFREPRGRIKFLFFGGGGGF